MPSWLPTKSPTCNRSIEVLEKHRKVLTGFYVNRPTLIVALVAARGSRRGGDLVSAAAFCGGCFGVCRRSSAPVSGSFSGTSPCWISLTTERTSTRPSCAGSCSTRAIPSEAVWVASNSAIERKGEVRPQANLVETLYKAGKKDQARTEFEKLRELAGSADLDSPPLARLEPIAREFGFPTDWRLRQKIGQALAGLRPLKPLGAVVVGTAACPGLEIEGRSGSRAFVGRISRQARGDAVLAGRGLPALPEAARSVRQGKIAVGRRRLGRRSRSVPTIARAFRSRWRATSRARFRF